MSLKTNETFFVGGTVDIAAMEIESEKTVRQLHYAEGGAYGGVLVNENFVEFLKKIFGAKEMTDLKAQDASGFEEMVQVSSLLTL